MGIITLYGQKQKAHTGITGSASYSCNDPSVWNKTSANFYCSFFCLQDVLQDKPVSLRSYTYDRCVSSFSTVFQLFTDSVIILFVENMSPTKRWKNIFNFSFLVSTLMWHLVRKQVTAMTAWLVEARGTENPGNTTASLLAHAPDKKRPANPNWACSMWVMVQFMTIWSYILA